MTDEDLDDLHWSLFTAERAAAEERDADALDTQRSGLTMRDHYVDAMHRGDEIALSHGSSRWTGTVVDVHGEAVRVETDSGSTVHVRVSGPQTLEIVTPATSGGRTAGRSHGSLESVLHEAHLIGHAVILRTAPTGEVRGIVDAVGRDHITVAAAEHRRTTHVPFDTIVAVVTPTRS